MKRLPTVLTAAALFGLALPAGAAPPTAFPEVIQLPDGFQPEGIAIGGGPTAYAGSLVDGDIVEVDLRTGEVTRLVDIEAGPAVGLDLSANARVLSVAGGPSGTLTAYDTDTGDELAQVQLTEPGTFVNDVITTRDAAYLTNSNLAEVYRVPLDRSGVPTGSVEVLPLTGDYELVDGFNANGIEVTPNGRYLLVIQSQTGTLYRVDADTGEATAIAIDGATEGALTAGDGIELTSAHRLKVVRNQLNVVATVDLSSDLTSGTVVDQVTDPDFDVPTTIASLGRTSWVVNARFSTPPTPATAYTLVRVG